MRKIDSKLKRYGALAGSLTAIIAFAGGVYAAVDAANVRPAWKFEHLELQAELKAQLNENRRAIALFRFQYLWEKSKHNRLTFDEQQELCQLARLLDYRNVQGCQ